MVTLVVRIGRAVALSLPAAPHCGSDRSEADLTLLKEREGNKEDGGRNIRAKRRETLNLPFILYEPVTRNLAERIIKEHGKSL